MKLIKALVKSIVLRVMLFFAQSYIDLYGKWDALLGQALLLRIINKGNYCKIEGYGKIYEPEKLILGNAVSIGRNVFIRGKGGVTIGSYTHISRNVTLHTVNHNINGNLLPYDRTDILKPIIIGNYVWIGMNVNILPGVIIGDGAVIGMGSTITKEVKPGEIVVSSKQRSIKFRNDSHTAFLQSNNCYLKMSD